MNGKSSIETGLERALFASRWLMAPIYLGLMLSLIMLVVVFVRELAYYMPKLFVMDSEEAILAVLTLIDLSLAGNLLLIVLFSGYENFVSRIDVGEARERPDWMGTVDFSGLKLKLVASIVAISAIHLLKWFMEIGEYPSGHELDVPQLRWLVIIHLTFVVSGVLLALMDWLAARTDRH
ncbi:MAG: TIGR00645 family protein [Amaricoccus sp.]